MRQTLVPHGRGLRVGKLGHQAGDAAGYSATASAGSSAIRKGTRATPPEVLGVAEETPTLAFFPSGGPSKGVVVRGVKNVPGQAALKRDDSVDLPAFQHLGKALCAGKGVTSRERPVVPDVEVAVGVLCLYVIAVLRQRSETVQGTFVQRMAVSVTGGEREAVSDALGEGGLQAVVVGIAVVGRVVDIPESGELGGVWVHRVVGGQRECGVCWNCYSVNDLALIEVAQTRQPGAVVANVANLQGQIAGEGVRDTKAPIRDVGVLEIRVHRKQVAIGSALASPDGGDRTIHRIIPVYWRYCRVQNDGPGGDAAAIGAIRTTWSSCRAGEPCRVGGQAACMVMPTGGPGGVKERGPFPARVNDSGG